jgi:hypothetical protein
VFFCRVTYWAPLEMLLSSNPMFTTTFTLTTMLNKRDKIWVKFGCQLCYYHVGW